MSEVVVQQAKVASFMAKRNTLEEKIKQDEEELKQLEEQLAKPAEAPEPAEEVNVKINIAISAVRFKLLCKN